MTDSAIETFLDEVRPVGKANGLLKEEHVEIIRTALVNRYDAAGDEPASLNSGIGCETSSAIEPCRSRGRILTV
jgi:hypothetical protein